MNNLAAVMVDGPNVGGVGIASSHNLKECVELSL
jgi:hypothetical protein